MNYSEPKERVREDHSQFAEDAANEIMDRFEASEQNEVLKQIYMFVKERRQMLVQEAEKNLEWLRGTLEQL